MICFPVTHMHVFLCYLLHVHCTCICTFVWPVLSKYGSKICLLNDKKQVFILKFYWSDVLNIIDYVKYNRSSKIKHHFDQFSIIIDRRWNTNRNLLNLLLIETFFIWQGGGIYYREPQANLITSGAEPDKLFFHSVVPILLFYISCYSIFSRHL